MSTVFSFSTRLFYEQNDDNEWDTVQGMPSDHRLQPKLHLQRHEQVRARRENDDKP